MMERGMRGNFHVPCGGGEKMEIISKSYLFLYIVGAWNILNKKHKYDLVDFRINHRQPINIKVSTV